MLMFSAALSIGRRCVRGSIRRFSLAAEFAPWPRIPQGESPRPGISRVPHLMLWSRSSPQIYLYDLGDEKQLKLHREISLPEITGCRCIGSSHGFVFALSVRGFQSDDVVVAVDPVYGDELRLPPLPRDMVEPASHRFFAQLHSKITVSPSLDLAFLLRRTSFTSGSIYFARLAPKTDAWWTPIASPMLNFEDCAFHEGCFLAVNDNGDFTTFNDGGDPSRPPRPLVHASNLEYDAAEDLFCKYLVESPDGNHLFLVNREIGGEDHASLQTRRFRVWRLDKGDRYMWKPVKKGLGGLAFFVGPVRSFSLPATDFPCLNPDSIYFTAHLRPGSSEVPRRKGGLSDTGVFNLQDGSVRFFRLPDADSSKGVDWLPPSWIVPTTC